MAFVDLSMNRVVAASRPGRAFTLIELLVVIGVIAILIALLVPTLARARQQAVRTKCAANLRQAAIAFQGYLVESRGMMFWRGEDVSLDGMDWYVWGGQEAGNRNTGQAGLFNRFQPRPLNPHVKQAIKVFQCPADSAESSWWNDGAAQWEQVGTSYNFNATGNPLAPGHRVDDPKRGLAGRKVSVVRNSSATVLFFDAAFVHRGYWHGQQGGTALGNIAFVDGHVSFLPRPTGRESDVAWLE